jgi:predicted transcriptional regulator
VATSDPIQLATEIMAAYVANNSVPRADLPALFEGLHAALKRLTEGGEISSPVDIEKPAPAVPIRKSVTPDYLICLDDGLKFKSMRRHLTTLGMTPEQYRLKWNLPGDYPMVASTYAAQRSALAKTLGLGQLRKKPAAVPASGESKVSAAPSESALTINSVAPDPAANVAAKSKAKIKRSEVVAAPPAATVKRKPGRPRKVA